MIVERIIYNMMRYDKHVITGQICNLIVIKYISTKPIGTDSQRKENRKQPVLIQTAGATSVNIRHANYHKPSFLSQNHRHV